MNLYSDGVEENPFVWWKIKGMKEWKSLAPIAERVFSLIASSALAESSFMAFIKNKLRNCLSTESHQKLHSIRTNKRKLDQLSLVDEDMVEY